MPRYFFDIHDSVLRRDDKGIECMGLNEIRRQAKLKLPDVARNLLARDGDHNIITILVRDEDNSAVYTATLTFSGLMLNEV